MSRIPLAVLLALGVPARSLLAADPPDARPVDTRPPTALERRACERRFWMAAQITGSDEPRSDGDLATCVSGFRRSWAEYPGEEDQYARWLECEAKATSAGECGAIHWKHISRKITDTLEGIQKEDERQERKALDALSAFRDKGLLGTRTFKAIEVASQDDRHASLTHLFEDAVHVLEGGRVRPGTQLSIYPHEGLSFDRPRQRAQKGERAADLAFVDAVSGKRVIRFSRLSVFTLLLRIMNGEVANALTWVAEKPAARSLEVWVATDEKFPAHLLLASEAMKGVGVKLGKRMPKGMGARPLLMQGDTNVSYERWLALAEQFRALGLDNEKVDSKKLAGLVTLGDLERALNLPR